MPVYTREQAEKDSKLKVLSNGAVYDNSKKRIVGSLPGGPTTKITQSNAVAYAARRAELRSQVIAQAANEAVENDTYRANYGDMAFVAAIAQAQYIKATTPDDPKSTAAANFLLEQAGISAKQAQSTSSATSDDSLRGVLADLAAIARAVNGDADAKCSYLKHGSVVDGSVMDDDDVKKDSEDKSGGGG